MQAIKPEDLTVPLSGLVEESVVDGTGIRFTVFVQGCPHRCFNCHNPHTHAFSGGTIYTVSDLMQRIRKNPLLDGVTFSGGEPFCHAPALKELAASAHAGGLNVWCYTGYTLEELLELSRSDGAVKTLLDEIDVLVDGRYVDAQRNLMLKFRGSENQRIINLKATRAKSYGEIVLVE